MRFHEAVLPAHGAAKVTFATEDGSKVDVDELQLRGSAVLAVGAENEPKQLYYGTTCPPRRSCTRSCTIALMQ